MNQIKEKDINALFLYDIQDNIIEYLDIESLFKFLQTCRYIYDYKYYSRYNYILCKKISKYFISFKNINLLKIIPKYINYVELKLILYKLYIYFKNHPETYLSEFLYELTNFKNEIGLIDKLFKEIISYCSFTKNGENLYNLIKTDDLLYIIMNSDLNKLQLIKKYIYIPIEVLEHCIFLRIKNRENEEANLLIEYLFYKHFWRNYEYVQDKITNLVTKSILHDNKDVLDFIYNKRQHYHFLINYQIILTFIMSQRNIKYIDYIEHKRIQQNIECKLKERNDLIEIIIITPRSIDNMVSNNNYKVLAKIIDIYLHNTINLPRYSKFINSKCLKEFKEMNVLKYITL